MDPSSSSALPRLHIDVPLGTPFREIRDAIFRQAWEVAGTQLRAAISLGITPETISRSLRRSKAIQAGVDQVVGSSGFLPLRDSTFGSQATDFGRAANQAHIGTEPVSIEGRATTESREQMMGQADQLTTETSDSIPVALLASSEDDRKELDFESSIDKDTEEFDL